MSGRPKETDAFLECLERATRHRVVHTLLRPPGPGRQEELRALAADLPPKARAPLAPLLRAADEEVEEESFRLLAPAGPVSVCASAYVTDGFADKGPILADIAGFYRAFGFTPEDGENPDHFAAQFAFLSFLALKEAWAVREGDREQAEIARTAAGKLEADHLEPYLERFLARLATTAPEATYHAGVAEFLNDWCLTRVQR